MIIQPSSTISLYKDIDITDGLQVTFATKAAQSAYFAKHLANTVNDCTYLRKSGRVKIQWNTALVCLCNYISFTNPAFENITFYAAITDYVYINNVTTEIQYEIDWYQTYMFTASYRPSLIVREHLSEADFQKAEVNPYDPSIYEFQTAENLISSPEIEKYYNRASSGTSGNVVLSDPGSSANEAVQSQIVFPRLKESGIEGGAEYQCLALQVSSFDTSEIPTDALNSFYSLFQYVLFPDNTLMSNGTSGPSMAHNFIPHAYGLYIITMQNDWGDKLTQALDFLTLQGLDGNIIGLYMLSWAAVRQYITNAITTPTGSLPEDGFTLDVKPRTYSGILSKKLMRYPFQYIRVSSDANTKEYQFENFQNIRQGGSDAYFRYVCQFDGPPVVGIAPYKYKSSEGATADYTRGLNPDERLDYSNFPQVGYSTDAYLSFLAAQYSKTIGSETEMTRINILQNGANGVIGNLGNAFGQFASGNWGTAAMAIANTSTNLMNTQQTVTQYNEMDALRSATAGEAGEVASGDIVSNVFGPSKPAYVADNYVAGTSNGYTQYYMGLGTVGIFTVTRVELLDSILKEYDRYFCNYGYSSNRLGIPRVCQYSQGGTTPHFCPTDDGQTTYVQTQALKVVTPLRAADRYISNIFNSGCRFLKGESL